MDNLEQVRKVTSMISNQYAEAYLYCHMSVVDIYLYVLRDIEIYQGGLYWFQSFLSHALTQIVYLKTAIEIIEIETENKN
jgi:hypothetical protein